MRLMSLRFAIVVVAGYVAFVAGLIVGAGL